MANGAADMGKRKAKATGDNAGSGASDGNAEKAKPSNGDAATVAHYVRYCREQIQAFITKLKADCAYIRETVEESLYRDGRGLLEDGELRKRLGTVAYIDNFFRHFGACLNFADIGALVSDMLPDDLYTAGGITDMKKLERVPALDKKLLKDITDAGNDDTWARNMTVYFFSLWVNYHVSPVVMAFRKWLEITGDNAPAVLRDYNALARCVCVFTLTEDNTTGGFFYDGGWFETFAICGMKRQADAGDRPTDAARRHETETGADGGENDTRLNPHARTLISDYKPNVSFYLRTEKGNTLINDLSPKQWESARFLLEGNADADGWVKMPDGWKRPQRWTGKQAAFWARVHSKLLDGGNGDGVGYFRIERLPATSKRGGKRANAGRGTRSPR